MKSVMLSPLLPETASTLKNLLVNCQRETSLPCIENVFSQMYCKFMGNETAVRVYVIALNATTNEAHDPQRNVYESSLVGLLVDQIKLIEANVSWSKVLGL